MTIANPIYDTVFKYLMEDTEIAKGLLSTILNVEITQLSLQPQEITAETDIDNKPVRVYRIDFAAVIKQEDGTLKRVLIELQKTKRSTNILRFRKYLAQNYLHEDSIVVNGVEQKQALEIVTIYFLGFNLDTIGIPVLHVTNSFSDATTGQILNGTPTEEFVRLLNHESYLIQIRKLVEPALTKLERVLSIFNQKYIASDEHKLHYTINTTEPLVEKMLNRLARAIADEDLRRKMDLEDEFEREYQNLEGLIQFGKEALKKSKKELAESKKELKKTKKEAEDSKKIAEDSRKIAERLKAEAEDSKKNAEDSKKIAEDSKKIAERLKAEAEDSKKNAEDSKKIAEDSKKEAERLKAEADANMQMIAELKRLLSEKK
jgi:methyl-accepting chemotaxis protein